MAKKNKIREQSQPAPAAAKKSQPVANQSSSKDFMMLAGCLLYMVVHFIPDMGAYDAMGPQWLYVMGLDFLIILYLLARKNDYQMAAANVFTNTFTKLYLGFFLIAGLSILTAINRTESWVCYSRLISTVIAFLNMAILLQGRLSMFRIMAQALAILLFIESCQTISLFLNGQSEVNDEIGLTNLIMSLKGTAGNKNIFAAGLAVKIPFVLYCIHRFKLVGKILNLIILLVGAWSIFLVSARAAFVSLLLIIIFYLVFCVIDYLKERRLEQTLSRAGFVLIPVIIAFFISQTQLSTVTSNIQDKAEANFGAVTTRLQSITKTDDESNQVRFRLWAHAVDYTKQHPFLGCGVGNWKIASIPYQRVITNDLYVPIHAHNDYVEVFAETGVLGGLLYLGIFICIAVFTYKTYFSKADEDTKLIAIFSFLAMVGYGIDALFNFPLERPVSQVFFALIAAINVSAYMKGRQETGQEKAAPQKAANFKPLFAFVSILLLIPSFYVAWETYQSLIVQKTVLGDLNNEPLRMDYKTVVPSFPSIPNLTATAQPIQSVKGRYLYEAGHYEEAFRLFQEGQKDNPVIGYSEFLKAGMFYKMSELTLDSVAKGLKLTSRWTRSQMLDSANANGRVAFYMRPKAKTYYQTYIAVLAKRNDTINMKKAFEEYDRYRHHAYGWDMFLLGMTNVEATQGKIQSNLLVYADSALKMFPGDSNLVKRRAEIVNNLAASNAPKADIAKQVESARIYQQAASVFDPNNPAKLEQSAGLFLKAYAINPGNFYALENAAMCYFNLKQFDKAITYFNKELALNVSQSGKPEFYKGVCMLNLGKPDGCSLIRKAKEKNYQEKMAEIEAILKSRCGG